MKLIALGDSITQGIPGVSYVPYLVDKTINYGKGGDTVFSLLKRINKPSLFSDIDGIVLHIGINDIYGNLSPYYKVLKWLKHQSPAKNIDIFKKHTINLFEYLTSFNIPIYFVPPLFLGEDLSSKWNQTVSNYRKTMIQVAKDFEKIHVINVFEDMKKELENSIQSKYLPIKITSLLSDVRHLTTLELINQKSRERGLIFTLDGVHLNERGARILASRILQVIKSDDDRKKE
jgi:lysophospholipase L1-like esterase